MNLNCLAIEHAPTTLLKTFLTSEIFQYTCFCLVWEKKHLNYTIFWHPKNALKANVGILLISPWENFCSKDVGVGLSETE